MPDLVRQGPAVTEIHVLQQILGCVQRIEATLHDVYVRLGWGAPAARAGAPPPPAPPFPATLPDLRPQEAPPAPARRRRRGGKPAYSGHQVRALRQRLGLSVKDFAGRLGTSAAMLYQIERGYAGVPARIEPAVRALMERRGA